MGVALKGILGGLVVFATSLIVSVVALEFIGQTLLFRNGVGLFKNVDHRMKPHTRETNGDGIRDAREADAYREEDRNIVFLGDSFVYGLGVERDEAIPRQFEQILAQRSPEKRIRAANFGWVSSSPLLSYRLLRDIGRKYKPDVVVMCVDMTDFRDDLEYGMILERKGIFRFIRTFPITIMGLHRVIALVPGLGWFHELLFGFPARRFFVTDAPLARTERYLTAIRSNIEALDTYCEGELHARFVVMVFPRSYQYSDRESAHSWERHEYTPLGPYALEPFKWFDRLRGEVRFPIHSLLPDFQKTTVFPTCIEKDTHWNKAGNRVAADAIIRYLSADGLLGPAHP